MQGVIRIMATIFRIEPPIWVECKKHGKGRAIILIDYGIDHNPIFLVQLNDGRFRCFDMIDVIGCENLTLGIPKPS